MIKRMKVLIACEESQEICKAFRARGHQAYSCDIQECSGGYPEWHLLCDAIPLLDMDWDLVIAHPPCTYLSAAGACRLWKAGELIRSRYKKGLAAKDFFMQFYNCRCPRVCVENPVPLAIYELPPYSQIISPHEFGHAFIKKTCLWLKGLPLLKPTAIVKTGLVSWVNSGTKNKDGTKRLNKGCVSSKKNRSKTFTGIAEAMADQWSSL